MSWLSELKWSNRLEHLYAMIAGEEELDESVPSTYDRKQGFLYKIAEKMKAVTGYTVEETMVTLFNDDVTTSDQGDGYALAAGLSATVTAPTITVTFDGDEYTVAAQDIMGATIYGELVDYEPAFDNYPFLISAVGNMVSIMTAEAGTYAIKIEAPGYEATTTPEFDAAVKAVDGSGGGNYVVAITMTDETTGTSNKSATEIIEAFEAGQNVVAFYSASEDTSIVYSFGLYTTETDAESAVFISSLDGSVLTVLADKRVQVESVEPHT